MESTTNASESKVSTHAHPNLALAATAAAPPGAASSGVSTTSANATPFGALSRRAFDLRAFRLFCFAPTSSKCTALPTLAVSRNNSTVSAHPGGARDATALASAFDAQLSAGAGAGELPIDDDPNRRALNS